MARTDNLTNYLTDVADAIREKKGTTETIPASSFDTEIKNLPSGGGDLSEYYKEKTTGSATYGFLEHVTKIPFIDTSGRIGFANFFAQCVEITTIPLIDTGNGTNFNYFFQNCRKLTTMPVLNTSKGQSFNQMFYNCQALKEVPAIDTSNGTSFNQMFYSCKELTTIPLLDFGKTNNINSFISGTHSKLVNLGGFKDLGKAYPTTASANYALYTLTLSSATNLSHDSLMNVINNLYDIKTAGCNTQKLVLGTTNKNKLTTDEIAIATNKGWTVS